MIHEAHTRGTERLTVKQIVEYSSNIGTITIARAPRRRAARVVDRPLRLRQEHRHRLPGRVARVRAAARPVVRLDDRHGADRSRDRRHAGADGARVLGDRERRHARSTAPHRPHRRPDVAAQQGTSCRLARRLRADARRCCAASSSRERASRRRSPATRWPARRERQRRSIPNGTYSTSRYVASFVGLVPASKPKLVIMVMVDEPRGGHLRRRRRGPGVPRDRSLQPPAPRDPARCSEDGTLAIGR